MTTTDIRKFLAEEAEASEAAANVDTPMVRNRVKTKEPSQVYSLRIPVERLEELRRRAEAQGIAPTVLMRRWVLDRLDDESEKSSRLEERRAALTEEHGEDALMVVTKSELVALMGHALREMAASADNGKHAGEDACSLSR